MRRSPVPIALALLLLGGASHAAMQLTLKF